mmetsp:Transcript_35027/g.80988  ORF Transcript_35027/g.80988 Transcript_35027/m.80988 type:complete len:81 (+) Transcript_35027:1080-1322(+)
MTRKNLVYVAGNKLEVYSFPEFQHNVFDFFVILLGISLFYFIIFIALQNRKQLHINPAIWPKGKGPCEENSLLESNYSKI